MSMLRHRDEFLDLYKTSSGKFEPSKPSKETDSIGFAYVNKLAEIETENRIRERLRGEGILNAGD